MTSIFGAIKSVMGRQNDDEYEYDDEYDYDYEEEGSGSYFTGSSSTTKSTADYYADRAKSTYSSSKVVDLTKSKKPDMKVVVLSPITYDDARTVCDHLKAWSPVIVKLDRLDKDEAQRVVDFIMGACYTMEGHVQEIKEDVFLVAPSMIGIEKPYDEKEDDSKRSFFSKFSVR